MRDGPGGGRGSRELVLWTRADAVRACPDDLALSLLVADGGGDGVDSTATPGQGLG
jgi:hypothetical protein